MTRHEMIEKIRLLVLQDTIEWSDPKDMPTSTDWINNADETTLLEELDCMYDHPSEFIMWALDNLTEEEGKN